MKKVTLEINTENDAFDTELIELRRILYDTADRIGFISLHDEFNLKDINGNNVGVIKFEED